MTEEYGFTCKQRIVFKRSQRQKKYRKTVNDLKDCMCTKEEEAYNGTFCSLHYNATGIGKY